MGKVVWLSTWKAQGSEANSEAETEDKCAQVSSGSLGHLSSEMGPASAWGIQGLGRGVQARSTGCMCAFEAVSEALHTSIALALKWGLQILCVVSTRGRAVLVK